MACSAELRRRGAPRLALVVVAVLAASAFTAGPETTAAMLTSTATTESSITTRTACLNAGGEPAPASAYTSGLLDLATPALRWSFSGGILPDAVATDGIDTTDGIAKPETVARGLLQCDPADFPGVPEAQAAPGALRLTQSASAGLAVADQPLTTSFTLLLWVLPDPNNDANSTGELASLGRPNDELVLSLSGSTVSLSFPVQGGDASPVSIGAVDPGRAQLVAVVYDEGKLTLTAVDKTSDKTSNRTSEAQTTWTPTGTPNALTIGARTGHPSAGALVDEVTLLTGAATPGWLTSLVDSDRWWLPADWTFGGPAAPKATLAVVPVVAPAEAPVVAPVVSTPTSAPTATPDPAETVDVLSSAVEPAAVELPDVEPTVDLQTTDDRRSKSTTSRHKPSR